MNKSNKLLSDIVSFRSYSKYIPHIGRRESLEETINRNMSMHLNKFPKLSRDIIKAYKQIHDLKVMPSMRSLQFGGEAIEKNSVRIYNCSFVHVSYERVFAEILYILLCGAGVGFSVQKHHVKQLPRLRSPKRESIYTINDSIEGWAEAVNQLMNAYFYGAIRPIFDFSSISPKGTQLLTIGAKAPGPEPLRILLSKVETILISAVNRKLTSLECHDIICIIADGVLSGGIRRAALISLFDKDDVSMLTCKHGDWWIKNPQRARANNSALLDYSTTKVEFDQVFDACIESKSGEPGFVWTNNKEMGTNPCFTGDMKLLTKDGYKKFSDLSGKENLDLINYKGLEVKGMVWSNGKKPTVKLTLSNGEVLTCTEDHKFMLSDGTECEAKNLKNKELAVSAFSYCVSVMSIEDNGIEEVFDFNLQDDTHWGVVSNNKEIGIIAHNCGEISLNSHQFCNLSTVNLTGIKSDKDLHNRVYAAALLGTIQATYTDFPYLSEKWKITTEKEALLGVSFTGVADASNITEQQLRDSAKLVLEVNEKYAKKLGINVAARATALKPEGSSSCALGSSSGIHARYSEYYLRRVRMNKDDALTKYLMSVIPELIEDDIFSSTTSVLTIPQESPKDSITRNTETALDLFNRVLKYNTHWVREGHRSGDNYHNVSCTINYKDHEIEELRQAMWLNRDKYSGISLLPFDGGSYQQAPFEECTKEKYEEVSKLVKEIDLTKVIELEDNTDRIGELACAGGVCEFTGTK